MSIESLLPDYLEVKRLNTFVAKLPVKGYPSGVVKKVLASEGASSEFNKSTLPEIDLIANLPGDSALALYRKKAPHCRFGMMLVSTKTTNQVALSDFDKSTRLSFYNTAALFGEFCKSRDLIPNVSFTFDPNTHDRKSGQSQKWFHMHLNSRTPNAIDIIEKTRKLLKEEPTKRMQRSFVEEYAVLSSMILADMLRDQNTVSCNELKDVFEEDGLPNLAIILNSGWNAIKSQRFDHIFNSIHTSIIALHERFKSSFFEGENGVWTRPRINKAKISKNIENFQWLSEPSKVALTHFLSRLRPDALEGRLLESFKKRPNSELTSFLYPLSGANYAITLTEKNDKLIMSVRPQLFSDTGAAGLYYLNGTMLKLVRGSETYGSGELEEKSNFEKEFSNSVLINDKNKKIN